MPSWGKLMIALLVPQAVGILSGLATAEGTRTWYPTLAKPAFTPPSWLFAPVWTALYLAMGVALYRVLRSGEARPALVAFAAQLALNGAWSFLFFGARRPGLAFAEIVLLWAAICGTLLLFWQRDRLAGLLMAPYLLWVSFAAVLNYSIWRLNL